MCLPGEDQTFMRPQRWNILVPRIKQLQSADNLRNLAYNPYGPLSILFAEDKKRQLDFWSKLAKPLAIPDPTSLMRNERHATRSTARARDPIPPCLLECLPVELLDMVMYGIEKTDIIAIAICSDVLWKHAMRHLQARLLSNVAPWAGMEIACTGTFLEDLPKAFTIDDLALRSVERKRLLGGSMCMSRQLNWAAITQYGHNIRQFDDVDDWLSVLRYHFSGKAGWGSKYTRLQRYVASFYDGLYPPKLRLGQIWKLRNLTTKEFVRLHFLRRTDEQPVIDVADVDWCRLDDILLLRICWTMKDYYGKPPDQGLWAGHCFDIIAASADDQFAEWTDATLEIAEEAKALKLSVRHMLPPGIDLVHMCSSGIYRLGENNHIDYNAR